MTYSLTFTPSTLVPETRRPGFLPRLFGEELTLHAEFAVYGWMGRLSPQDYSGGFWNFYELDGEPLYLAPESKSPFRIRCDTNGYEGEVSADAAGIIATLFTFSCLSFRFQSERLSDGYCRLYGYASKHPEAAEIFQAID